MELGISTFGEVSPDGTPGNAVNARARVQQLLQEVKLADEVASMFLPSASTTAPIL